MRIICSSAYLSHSEPLFKKLNVFKIDGVKHVFAQKRMRFCNTDILSK